MANADDKGVHRLNNMIVEEVSLVDRAANQRKFLLVKSEGGEMSELRADGRGGFTKVVRKAEDEETEKAKKPPFAGAAKPFGKPEKEEDDDAEKAKAKKADDGEDDEEETEKARKVLEAAGLTKAAKRLLGKADPEGMKLADEVAKMASELGDLAKAMKDEEEDEPSDVHMKKCMAMHKKMGGFCDKYMQKVGKSVVAKAGAKMAADRLDRLKSAFGTLESILNELIETPAKAKDHDSDPGDSTKAPAGFKESNPSAAPTNAMGEAAIKSIEAKLTKSLDEAVSPLTEIIAKQSAEIARLRKGVVASNSIPVEKSARRQASETAWPLDMGAPRSTLRKGASADKEESFLDAD